ncbi:HTH-type transcriptional regulator GlvR [Clostridium polyendosporum]|uniref:HTH-type transcriptional regulator GlvR n=1 Tax=Clostridium polyendosporum TaxID=69208 RepID=A0A919S254_9CLOT|nr:MurR/RpiR family transcriptional regulator [Clostridium polyendosporum]GIM30474.1 HTH-type transcriptional regulator GlvR [Clostridium polyendosporum]
MRLEELINNNYNKLNDNDLYILKYILNNKSECYNLGINELAKKCNVSRTTILRFTQKLGFKGYSEFRVRLKWQEENNDNEEDDYVEKLYMDLNETIKLVREKDFTNICKLIYNAERVFVYGTGTAQLAVAQELKRTFLAAHKYFHLIEGYREFEIITPSITERDIVIIISLSGNTTSLYSCVNELSIRGIEYISITKLSNNKLSRMTPHNLYITNSIMNLSNGLTSETFSFFFILNEVLFRQYINYQQKQEDSSLIIEE